MRRFYEWAGGRKVGNGLIYSALVTIMAFPLHAEFGVYAMALAGGLGITVASVAWEDARRPK